MHLKHNEVKIAVKTFFAMVISELLVHTQAYACHDQNLLLQLELFGLTGRVKALQGTVNLEMSMTMICHWINSQSYASQQRRAIETSCINRLYSHFAAIFRSGGALVQVGVTSIILNRFMRHQNTRK